MLRALLLMLLLLGSGSAASAMNEEDRKGKPQPLRGSDEELIRERERIKEEYWRMREERIRALRAATESTHEKGSRSSVPGWRGGGDDGSPSDGEDGEGGGPAGPIAISDNPVNMGRILLVTVGAGLMIMLVLRLRRSRRGAGDRRPAYSAKDGPMTVRLRPRPERKVST